MNAKNILRTAATLAVASTITGTALAADWNVQPANFDRGIVTGINPDAGTITVNGATYALRKAGDVDGNVTTGTEVVVTYVPGTSGNVALAVERRNVQAERNTLVD